MLPRIAAQLAPAAAAALGGAAGAGRALVKAGPAFAASPPPPNPASMHSVRGVGVLVQPTTHSEQTRDGKTEGRVTNSGHIQLVLTEPERQYLNSLPPAPAPYSRHLGHNADPAGPPPPARVERTLIGPKEIPVMVDTSPRLQKAFTQDAPITHHRDIDGADGPALKEKRWTEKDRGGREVERSFLDLGPMSEDQMDDLHMFVRMFSSPYQLSGRDHDSQDKVADNCVSALAKALDATGHLDSKILGELKDVTQARNGTWTPQELFDIIERAYRGGGHGP